MPMVYRALFRIAISKLSRFCILAESSASFNSRETHGRSRRKSRTRAHADLPRGGEDWALARRDRAGRDFQNSRRREGAGGSRGRAVIIWRKSCSGSTGEDSRIAVRNSLAFRRSSPEKQDPPRASAVRNESQRGFPRAGTRDKSHRRGRRTASTCALGSERGGGGEEIRVQTGSSWRRKGIASRAA